MANAKKKYYKLDNIGLIGVQEKKSFTEQKRDDVLTARIVKSAKRMDTEVLKHTRVS